MQNLLSMKGQAVLEQTMRLRPLLAFDFDGTLAPIVPRPANAHVSVAVGILLHRMLACVAPQ